MKLTLKIDDITQVYVWVDCVTETVEYSPHFDYEEDAWAWYGQYVLEKSHKET